MIQLNMLHLFLIVENNKIIAYLDANKDDDLEKYQDVQ